MAKRKPTSKPSPKDSAVQRDWERFLVRLPETVDSGKLSKALKMLRAERFQLFAEVQPEFVTGVVRSQSTAERVYACRLESSGSFTCCTQNLIQCVVSIDSPCKHLLVLVLGLVKAGELSTAKALTWLDGSFGCKPDKDVVTATFLKYKGVETGAVDWRPTETIPEDFYSM
jgi:hypothetical protein